MIIHANRDGSVELRDPDVFDAFAIRAPGLQPGDVAKIMGRAFPGEPVAKGDHVWVPLEALHALGGRFGSSDWRVGCDKMIDYARTQGWIDAEGLRVRAHLES